MAEAVSYDVYANLRLRGNFAQQVKRQSAALGPLAKRIDYVGARAQAMGMNWLKSSAAMAGSFARIGAIVAGGALLGGFALLVKVGSDFQVQLEDTKLSLASMFQLYEQNSGDLVANINQAEVAMRNLFNIAKTSPISFGEAVQLYQGAASQLIAANVSMKEQMEFMESAVLLKGVLPDMNVQDIGAQLGRVIGGGAGAEFEVWKRLQPAVLKVGKAAGVFGDNMRMGAKFTQTFNELAQASPREAFNLIRDAVKPLDKLGDEFRNSWRGILSTTVSNLQWVSAAFMAPFQEMRKSFLKHLNEDGLLSDKNMAKLEKVAYILGVKFAGVVRAMAYKLESWIQYAIDNWESIVQKFKQAGTIIAGLIKGAFFAGVAKMIAGAALVAGPGLARGVVRARGAGMAARGMFAGRVRAAHMGVGRGMQGRGRGATGIIGSMLGKVLGKIDRKGVMAMNNLNKFALKIASVGFVAGSAALVIGVAAAALLVFAVAIAGVAAYIISNWDAIGKSVTKAIDDGRITLIPFMVALYTMWERLKAVGEALLGSSDHALQFSTVLTWLTTAMEAMSWAIGVAMKIIAFSVTIWATLRLAFAGLMLTVAGLIDLMAKAGMVDKSAAEGAKAYANEQVAAAGDAFIAAGELWRKANEISDLELGKGQRGAAEAGAEGMAESIKNFFGDKDDNKKPKGPKVNVQNVTINQDLRDTDPDRLMSAFVKPLERMADTRIQSYEALDQGI